MNNSWFFQIKECYSVTKKDIVDYYLSKLVLNLMFLKSFKTICSKILFKTIAELI